MTTRSAAGILIAVILGGARASDHPTAAAAPVPGASAVAPADAVIVRLVSRRQTVIVLAGHGKSLYSVTDPSGRLVVSRATLEELRTVNPDAYKMVQPGATAYAGIDPM